MTIRFHRSIKLFPGIRLHISKRGLGISIGTRGLHVAKPAGGRPYITAGIPGTGISARQTL